MIQKVIEVTNLTKQFKSYKKKPGLKGSLQSFFNRNYTKRLFTILIWKSIKAKS